MLTNPDHDSREIEFSSFDLSARVDVSGNGSQSPFSNLFRPYIFGQSRPSLRPVVS